MADINLEELRDTLDEDTFNAIKAQFDGNAERDADAARAKRDLALLRDPDKTKDYPRAANALKAGLIDLGDATDDEAIKTALEAQEKKLEALGVPLPGGDPPPTPSQAPTPPADPTQALGAMPGGAPAPPERDLVREYLDAHTEQTVEGRERAAIILVEMNRAGMKDEIKELARRVSAKPIIPLGL